MVRIDQLWTAVQPEALCRQSQCACIGRIQLMSASDNAEWYTSGTDDCHCRRMDGAKLP